MKLLFLVAFIALVALAIYMVVKAIQSIGRDKWKPDILEFDDGSQEVVLVRGNHRPIVIHEIPQGIDSLEAGIERSIGWEEAKRLAKVYNK